MRCESAASLKGTGRPRRKEPTAGTKIREIYDLFILNKGIVIRFTSQQGRGHDRAVQDLINYYGLDIRKISHGKWVLAGEWFGKVYIDYIAEHIK